MYSSIEEEQRRAVINNCYWPLLRLAKELNLPFGVEASACTLEIAAALDPDFMKELRSLTNQGSIEFIGSGYAQIIKPLVPAQVNSVNLRLGHEVYDRLLGHRPQVALVSEQAYSAGLIRHYLDAGYKAIIMEWNNPARFHPEWDMSWRYLPQYACGQSGEKIALIWNDSIAFQKFQRYAHGDIELEEQINYLQSNLAHSNRVFPLYGNDAEIFDFRPGRYRTEADIHEQGEWNRIRVLFSTLLKDKQIGFIRPGEVLNFLNEKDAGNQLHLESSEQPVAVKKQGKYNLTRWAATGRNDLGINTSCYQLYHAIKDRQIAPDQWWRELCYLWSSDFRTHITGSRWEKYLARINEFKQLIFSRSDRQPGFTTAGYTGKQGCGDQIENSLKARQSIKREGRFLYVETDQLCLKLNCKKGLAIEGLWPGNRDLPFMIGTLGHGFYDDIALGADWFSGHVVLELMGHPKITDLVAVEPVVAYDKERGEFTIGCSVENVFGSMEKTYIINEQLPVLTMNYRFNWLKMPFGSIRLGSITLNPDYFNRKKLFYRSCNGGFEPEQFNLAGKNVDHGSAVSFMVSSCGGIGLTDGLVEIGDGDHGLRITVDQSSAAMLGLITYYEVGKRFFYRLSFSAGEVDDTSKIENNNRGIVESKITLTLVKYDGE